jgi:glucose/arabinose dehydrogenase
MRIAALALVGAVAVALVGCAPATHPTPAPTPKATAVFASDDAALKAAEKAYAAYRAMANTILQDGGNDPQRIDSLATGKLLLEERDGMSEFRSNHYHSVGDPKVLVFRLESAKRSLSQDEKEAVIAYTCVDVSDVDVIDSNGRSVVSPSRPAQNSYEVSFDLINGSLLPASQDPWTGDGVC